MTEKTAIATLGGVKLLNSSPVKWDMSDGAGPSTATFDVRPADQHKLLGGAPDPISLVYEGGATIDNLFVIHAEPGPNANILRVRVVDRRYWWANDHITRSFNVRRHVNPKRLVNPQTIELSILDDDVQYWPWSLKDGETPWTADEAIRDVFAEVLESEGKVSGGKAKLDMKDVAKQFADFPVEDWVFDDPAPVAIGRMLANLPNAAVTIDADGTVRIRDKASGKETDTLDAIGVEVVNEGHAEWIVKSRVRPSGVRCLITKEAEVRFDFEELPSLSSTTAARDEDDRFCENVLQIPDYQLDVGGETMCQSTWVTFTEALTAWNAEGNAPGLGRGLTMEDIRRHMMPTVDLWTAMGLHGILTQSQKNWAARIAAITRSYRRTFRINRRWMDRILALMPYRVATINPTTGTRAPAVSWFDYSYLASMRSLSRDWILGGAPGLAYARNVKVYPASDIIDENTKPSPAKVSIEDEDQGIIAIDILPDPDGVYQTYLPGLVGLNNAEVSGSTYEPGIPGPGGNLRDQTNPLMYNCLSEINRDRYPKLHAPWKLSFVISAVPGAPNNDNRLHAIEIKASDTDMQNLLPVAARKGIGEAFGPVLEIRITIETARVAWLDARSDDIEKMFGVGDDIANAGRVNVDDLVVNQSDSNEAGDLTVICRAAAARVYGALADHHQGRVTGKMTASARLDGWATSLTQELTPKGALFTRLSLPDELPSLSIYGMMDPATRAVIMRLALPIGAKK